MNILQNFILHEAIVCDVKDSQWFNKAFKSFIPEKMTLLENIAKTIIISSFYSAQDFFKKSEFFN